MNDHSAKRALDLVVAGVTCLSVAPLVAGLAFATWLSMTARVVGGVLKPEMPDTRPPT
jgi:hypothetical protein